MPIDASAIGASIIRPPPFGSAAATGPNQDPFSMNNEAVQVLKIQVQQAEKERDKLQLENKRIHDKMVQYQKKYEKYR